MTDTERLDYIILKLGENFRFNVQDILGRYEGDDDDDCLAEARAAIDEAALRDPIYQLVG